MCSDLASVNDSVCRLNDENARGKGQNVRADSSGTKLLVDQAWAHTLEQPAREEPLSADRRVSAARAPGPQRAEP
jgi:hypothetical protein